MTTSPVSSSQEGLSLRRGDEKPSLSSSAQGGLSLKRDSSPPTPSGELVLKRQDSPTRGLVLNKDPENPLGSLPSNVTSHGKAYLTKTVEEGVLSVRADTETRKQTDMIIQEVALQIQEARRYIDVAIAEFRDTSSEGNAKSKNYAFSLIDILASGGEVTQTQAHNATFIDELVKQENNRYFESAKQLMDLEKINMDGKLGPIGGLIKAITEARMSELKILSEKLKTMREQEDHELAVDVAIRNQLLKEQSVEFDQLMQGIRLDSETKQKELENDLKERAQTHQEEKDLKDLAIKEKKSLSETELQKEKQNYEKELEERCIKSNAAIEHHRIAAETFTKVTDSAAKVAAPKCTLQ